MFAIDTMLFLALFRYFFTYFVFAVLDGCQNCTILFHNIFTQKRFFSIQETEGSLEFLRSLISLILLNCFLEICSVKTIDHDLILNLDILFIQKQANTVTVEIFYV